MNAIVFVGDQKATHPLCGMNKGFLLLEGWPLFIHVLSALNQASRIDAIYIIGPRKPLMDAVEKALPTFLFSKKIEILEQKESLIENLFHAYHYAVGIPSIDAPPALFLPSDIPLVTGQEIDTFIANANMDEADYCLGVTPKKYLERFHPKSTEPGINISYLYLKDQIYRMNNLHLGRLSPLLAGGMLQTIYNHRHQKNIWNRIVMGLILLKDNRAMSVLSFYLLAQTTSLLSRVGLHRVATYFRRFLDRSEIEKAISHLLGVRFKTVETTEGGAALDIDDEATYKTISRVFAKWHSSMTALQMAAPCPFESSCHKPDS